METEAFVLLGPSHDLMKKATKQKPFYENRFIMLVVLGLMVVSGCMLLVFDAPKTMPVNQEIVSVIQREAAPVAPFPYIMDYATKTCRRAKPGKEKTL